MSEARRREPRRGVLCHPVPVGGAEGRGQASRQVVASRLRTCRLGRLDCGALQTGGCVHAHGHPSARGRVSRGDAARLPCHTPGGSFVFHGGTTPLSPVKVPIPLSSAGEAASFRHCQSRREFGRTGVRCEVAGLGWGVRKGRRPQSLPEGPCRVLASCGPETPPFLWALQAPDTRSNSLLLLFFLLRSLSAGLFEITAPEYDCGQGTCPRWVPAAASVK